VKYINHLNAVIAIAGLIIIAQTLGRTLWDGAPALPGSIEVPSARARVMSPPQSNAPARVAPVFPPAGQLRATDSEDDSAGHGMPTPGLAAREAAGVPAGVPTPGAIRPERRLEDDDQSETGSGVISVPGADGRNRSMGGAFPPGQFGQRPLPRGSRAPGYVPPPLNEGAVKRQPGEGVPSSPPVRSSVPEQRIR
jgi:hypothetical protein